MTIAYLILVHKSPAQLARLVGALSGPESVFYIHVDRKVDQNDFRCALRPFEGSITFVCDRIPVRWGAFSTVSATLALMRACLAAPVRADRAVLLSGQDYPIKCRDAIRAFFERTRNKEFIEHWQLPSQAWKNEDGGMDRLRYYWLIDFLHLRYSEKLFRIQKSLGFTRPLPKGIRFYGGSQWFMLSESCLRYLVDYCAANPRFDRFWRMTRLPDEMFFNTILMNSGISSRVENNSYRYKDWLKGPEAPRALRLDDFDALKTSPCLFARKFDMARDSSAALMDRIDEELLH